jgi:glycosyltransferase involved in cell wall biosynthesis
VTRGSKLFLTTDAVGGVWTYSVELAAALAAEDDTAVTLTVLGPPASAEQVERATAIPGLRLVHAELPLDWTAESETKLRATAAALAGLAEQAEADLVQLHAPALACADFRAPVISVVHSCVATWWAAVRGTELPADFAWRTELAREGIARSDLVVAPTRAFAGAVQQVYALEQPPAAVHNGRSPLPAPSFPRSDCAFTAGRLWDESKNAAAFDRAAALAATPFRAAGPLAGPNGASTRLQHAEALGSLPEQRLAEEFAGQPIFVSAALYEPFGLSVLEAAQAGCALVLSDLPTFQELWSGAALFVDRRDDRAIAAAVDRLAAQPGERERLGAAAQERAAHFTPEQTARTMLAHYRSLSEQQRRVAA